VEEARIAGEIAVEQNKPQLEMLRIKAAVEQEAANAELVDLKKGHEKRHAIIEGGAEAGKIMAFVEGMGERASDQVKVRREGGEED
jgi:hypothetical protein